MHILFVCTGNTCRSAMAEGLMKKAVTDAGLKDITVSSCGTSTLPSFRVPNIVLLLMNKEGIDLSKHLSTQISEQLVSKSDLILVMAEHHKDAVNHKFPEASEKVFLLKQYVKTKGDTEIPDPIGQSEEVYTATMKELKECVNKLVGMLKNK